MVFSSTVFLFAFLPLFLAAYFLVPWRPAKNVILLVFSLVFYAWGEPIYVWLMVASILINWITALIIDKFRHLKFACLFTAIIGIGIDIGILCFWKYEGFIANNLNLALGEEFLLDLQLALPIGISFFTLQAITYVADVYAGKVKVQKNPLYLGMYIAMFPQLVAGPIVRYADIESAIKNRKATLEGFAQGLRLFCIGLGKKVLLANTAAILADSLLSCSASDIGFIGCFSAILAYTFQIYFDFSGYSDMAIGLGKMMGFNYPRNFNYPYISRSATEFWRRWHISLGSFFRDYVYIPLGGNRVSKPRYALNIFAVWALTGIWHGAAWNFLIWGLYWGAFILLEKMVLLDVLKRIPKIFGHIYCILIFFIGWTIFAVSGLSNVGEWIQALFGAYGFSGTSEFWELQSWSYVSLIPVFVVGSLPWAPFFRKKIESWVNGDCKQKDAAAPLKGNSFVPFCQVMINPSLESCADLYKKRIIIASCINVLVDISLLLVFDASCAFIVSSSYNPFIYFQF